MELYYLDTISRMIIITTRIITTHAYNNYFYGNTGLIGGFGNF